MENKWIVKGTSGSWVMNESEVVNIVGEAVVEQIKAEAQISDTRRAFKKIDGKKVECTIINLRV